MKDAAEKVSDKVQDVTNNHNEDAGSDHPGRSAAVVGEDAGQTANRRYQALFHNDSLSDKQRKEIADDIAREYEIAKAKEDKLKRELEEKDKRIGDYIKGVVNDMDSDGSTENTSDDGVPRADSDESHIVSVPDDFPVFVIAQSKIDKVDDEGVFHASTDIILLKPLAVDMSTTENIGVRLESFSADSQFLYKDENGVTVDMSPADLAHASTAASACE